MERISSRQNALVKRFRALARPGHAEPGALLDGAHLLEEALAAGTRLEAVAVNEALVDGALRGLATRAAAAGARIFAVTPAVLGAISPVRSPSGVVAIARVDPATLDAVLRHGPQLVVILHDVQDPGNVGAAIRAADACGATGVIATSGGADPFGWKALRGAMGSALRLPIGAKMRIEEVRSALKTAGVPLVAAVPRGGAILPSVNLTGPAAIVLGGEGSGLPEDLIRTADTLVTIPMQANVESLNVAVAAGIILYEAARQRSDRRGPTLEVRSP